MPSISELYSFSAPVYSQSNQQRQQEKNQHSHGIYEFAKTTVAHKLAKPAIDLHISKTKHGKPFFTDTTIPWQISVSHNKAFSLLYLANSPCAVDTELCIPRVHSDRLIARVSKYFTYPVTETTFYPLWTLLEAWCKLHNQTLWQTLQQQSPLPAQVIDQYLTTQQAYYKHYALCNIQPTPDSSACLITKLTQPPTQGISLILPTVLPATYLNDATL